MEYFGWILILSGCILNLISASGCLRMPDFFSMIQAAGIGDSCGTPLILFGLIFVAGISMVSLKILILIGMVLLLSPTATHALARASLDDDQKLR